MENLADDILVKQIKAGNLKAYEELIRRYKDRAYGLLLNMLKNKMDAEEVLQDAFIKVYYHIKDFKGKAKFSTWFYKIVYNTALSFLRSKRKNMEKITDTLESASITITGADYFPNMKDEDLIRNIIEMLPVKAALVVNLFYIDGLTIKEIAEVTNYSADNVKVLLFRARKLLRKIIIEKNLLEELI